MDKVKSVAMRGRMYMNQPQHYEARTDDKSNALTTVPKDCMIAEKVYTPVQVGILPNTKGEQHNSIGTRIYSIECKSKTQMALGGGLGAKTGLYAIPVVIGELNNDSILDEQ